MAVIKIQNLTKVIGRNTVLDNVSIEMCEGHIYGLRGKNGCGKTMLMRAVCGLIRPTSGRVLIDDKELHKDIGFPQSIGALIENPSFLKEYSGRRNLEMLNQLSKHKDSAAIDIALERVCLTENADKLYGRYSLGMKQKLGIAYAILNEPEVIVLDEPINALDEDSVGHIRDVLFELKNKGKLIIVACHDKEEMNCLADNIFVMEDGKVIGCERNDQDATITEA